MSTQEHTKAKEFHITSNIIAASAGTGKTYQLASRYIALLVLGARPEEIIALTFTRKASGEFRNRILHALAEGACDMRDEKTGRNPLTVRVWEVLSGLSVTPTEYGEWKVEPASNPVPLLPMTAALVREAADMKEFPEDLYHDNTTLKGYYKFEEPNAATFAKLLRDMVSVLSRLKLTTIDSFFASLVATNSLELGMNHAEPLDPAEETKAQAAAIRDYLDAQGAEEKARREFLHLFSQLTGGVGNRTQSKIETELNNFLRVYHALPKDTIWGDAEAFGHESKLNVASDAEMEEYHYLCDRLREMAHAQDGQELTPTQKKQFIELAAGSLEIKATLAKLLKSATGGPLLDMKRMAERIVALAPNCRLRTVADKTAALKSLMDGYAAAYDQRMQTAGKLTFADVARLAKELMLKENGNEHELRHHVAYRMGAELHHWMLDEFQDTSEDQFATLSPLLSPIAEDAGANGINFADERWQAETPVCLQGKTDQRKHHVAADSLFVVGDVKQSIYGFRTGRTEVFDRLKTDAPWKTALTAADLTRSFRSSPVIMGKDGFINSLFGALHEVECGGDYADIPACIEEEQITSLLSFKEHNAAKNMPGYVEIRAIAPPDKEDKEDDSSIRTRIYDAIVDTLRQLTDADIRPRNGMSIAILVRSNTEADEIMSHLATAMPELPTLLVKDTLAAAACPLGEILLHFFRWLLHPSDAAALGVVRTSFLGKQLKGDATSARRKCLETIQLSGYAILLDEMLTALNDDDRKANSPIIKLWRDHALAADTTGLTMAEWVNRMKHLSQQGVSSAGAVQIMTMHKSKGLEFDAVILPYCSTNAVDATKELNYFISEDGKSLLLTPGKVEELPTWGSSFTHLVTQWQKEQRKEAYNLLYVAATRARHANYIICHGKELYGPESKNSKKEKWKSASRSTAGLIRQAVAKLRNKPSLLKETDCNQVIYTHPDNKADWFNSLKTKDAGTDLLSPSAPLGKARTRRKRVNPSAEDTAEKRHTGKTEKKVKHADYGKLTASEFGTAVHECWEQISWLHENEPCWLKSPRTDEQKVVAAALQQPEIRKLFTRQSHQEVYNEQWLEAIDAKKNEWFSGTIDRLVLTTDTAGNVTSAHIIDFKTNQLDPTREQSYTDLRDEYAAQMTAYRKLIAGAFELPESVIAVTLLSCPLGVPASMVPY